VLVGSKAFIAKAFRARKSLGGGMRQAGVIAAAGVVALETMPQRLAADHANARLLAESLATVPGLRVDLERVRSNMVYFDVADDVPLDAAELCRRASAGQVRMLPTAARRIRAVLHCWVSRDEVFQAADVIRNAMTQGHAGASGIEVRRYG
jgi:threonine aldolase